MMVRAVSRSEDGAWDCSLMSKLLHVHSQHFLRERIWIRSGGQTAPAAILNDGTGGVQIGRRGLGLQLDEQTSPRPFAALPARTHMDPVGGSDRAGGDLE